MRWASASSTATAGRCRIRFCITTCSGRTVRSISKWATTERCRYLQSVVTLAPTLNQPSRGSTTASLNGVVVTGGTGACVNGASYWDIGVRGDTGPTNHSSGFTLSPHVLGVDRALRVTPAHNNLAPSALGLVSQYCNGSRMPPEFASGGYQVPPGTNEGNVPVPVFSLLAGATVDEGNNWVNIKWGPLAMTSPMAPSGSPLGNYAPAAGSPAIDAIPVAQPHPSTDFFGNPRPSPANPTAFDVGAVEFQGPNVGQPTLTSIDPNTGGRNTSVPVTLTGTNLTGVTAVNVCPAMASLSAVSPWSMPLRSRQPLRSPTTCDTQREKRYRYHSGRNEQRGDVHCGDSDRNRSVSEHWRARNLGAGHDYRYRVGVSYRRYRVRLWRKR